MQINEFIEATSRIEQYFGKEYSNEQRQIMFEELKKMPIEKYKQAIANCIKSCKYMPKLADIIEAAEHIVLQNQVQKQYEPCKICESRGIVKYTKILHENGYEYEYACRCICKNGENYNKKIPTFEELGIRPGEKLAINFE